MCLWQNQKTSLYSRQEAKKESLNVFLKNEEKYVGRVIRFSVETKLFEFDIVCKIGKQQH